MFDGRKGPICVCRGDLDCPAEFKPVCGSDAKRYNNECIMKATACREGKSVKKAADGFCTPGMSIFVLEVNTSFLFHVGNSTSPLPKLGIKLFNILEQENGKLLCRMCFIWWIGCPMGQKFFNSLDNKIINSQSLSSFKKKLKIKLLSKYENSS